MSRNIPGSMKHFLMEDGAPLSRSPERGLGGVCAEHHGHGQGASKADIISTSQPAQMWLLLVLAWWLQPALRARYLWDYHKGKLGTRVHACTVFSAQPRWTRDSPAQAASQRGQSVGKGQHLAGKPLLEVACGTWLCSSAKLPQGMQ